MPVRCAIMLATKGSFFEKLARCDHVLITDDDFAPMCVGARTAVDPTVDDDAGASTRDQGQNVGSRVGEKEPGGRPRLEGGSGSTATTRASVPRSSRCLGARECCTTPGSGAVQKDLSKAIEEGLFPSSS